MIAFIINEILTTVITLPLILVFLISKKLSIKITGSSKNIRLIIRLI